MTENETEREEERGAIRPTDVRFVGPATAAAIEEAAFDAGDIETRGVSYRTLLDAGVNPGVAARLRREHSLPWSFEGSNEDLADRSAQVRGLRDDEREWVAASSGDWDREPATTDGSGDTEVEEAAWRERSSPDPVTDVSGIDDGIAAELAEAGITSVRSMAIADPERVADSLALDPDRVTGWRDAARDLL